MELERKRARDVRLATERRERDEQILRKHVRAETLLRAERASDAALAAKARRELEEEKAAARRKREHVLALAASNLEWNRQQQELRHDAARRELERDAATHTTMVRAKLDDEARRQGDTHNHMVRPRPQPWCVPVRKGGAEAAAVKGGAARLRRRD
eukprot:gene15893-9348_t